MEKNPSPSGFTLVEIMLVLAIVSILSIGFASYLYQQSNSTSNNQKRQDIATLQSNVLDCASSSNCLLSTENLNK